MLPTLIPRIDFSVNFLPNLSFLFPLRIYLGFFEYRSLDTVSRILLVCCDVVMLPIICHQDISKVKLWKDV